MPRAVFLIRLFLFPGARNEGINSKIRTVTSRAYGFHRASSVISYIILCSSGIHLEPAFNYPFAYH